MTAVLAPKRTVLRYHGSKFRLGAWVVAHFPKHRVYCESFGGSASVLLRKPRSHGEIYNDIDGDVVNVFRVLQQPHQAAHLKYLVTHTPFARAEFKLAYEPTDDPVERARRTIVRSFMGFGSASVNPKHSTGFRSNSHRNGTTAAQDWASYPSHVQAFTDRLRGVVIEHRDALQVIQQHDSPDTLHYIDPPYPLSVRGNNRGVRQKYRYEFDDTDHRALAAVLHAVEGMVVLSGYACPLYDQLFPTWERVTKATHADGANPRTEVLWIKR